MDAFSVQIYTVVFITKFCWESGFLKGGSNRSKPGDVPPPPLDTNGCETPALGHLRVNI